MGHISFGIAGFEPDAVKAELTKRGLNAREDTGGRGDIHTAPYKSYHTTTPNGFDLQISNTITKRIEGSHPFYERSTTVQRIVLRSTEAARERPGGLFRLNVEPPT